MLCSLGRRDADVVVVDDLKVLAHSRDLARGQNTRSLHTVRSENESTEIHSGSQDNTPYYVILLSVADACTAAVVMNQFICLPSDNVQHTLQRLNSRVNGSRRKKKKKTHSLMETKYN